MKYRLILLTSVVTGLLAAVPSALAQNENDGHGQAVVTVLPKNDKQPTADVSSQALKVEVNGKKTNVGNWAPLRGPQAGVELVVLIDGGARTSLGREWDDITHFVQGLPPNVKVALAYMENGGAALAGPLSSDHAQAAKELHLPAGVPGYSASPYFCLSALAKNWPSRDPNVRREVIMITDGVDYYNLRYDPDDPYVHASMEDAARAGLVVYSIYWKSAGPADRTWYETNAGQNLLTELTQSTGGNSYWIGFGNPVSLSPYFDDFGRRLNNQYELGFGAPIKGKPEVEELKVKVDDSKVKVDAPQRVLVVPEGANQAQ
jgi:hypothetical protein